MTLLFDLWKLLDSRQRREFLLVQALALIMAFATLVGVAAVVPFFAVLGDRQLIARNALLSWLYQHLGFSTQSGFLAALGAALLFFVLLSSAVNLVGSLVTNQFAYRVGHRFCVMLFDEYLHRSHQFHLASNSATLFNNIVWEVARGTTGMLQSFLLLTTNIAVSMLFVASIVVIDPAIALVAVAALGGSYAIVYFLARQRLLLNGLLVSRHTEERTKIVNEAFGAIREIIVLNEQEFFHKKFSQSSAAIARAALSTNTIAQSPRHVLDFVVAVALVCGALLSIERSESAGAWFAKLSFLGFAAYRLLPALQQIFNGVVKIRGDHAAFARIAEDLRAACRPEPRAVRNPDVSAWQGRPHRGIELKGVSFCYAPDRPPTIRDAHLTVPAGAIVGLVGPSGSGKTTLAELFLGLLCPTAGVIEIDGIALTDLNRADWQSAIAYVPQQGFLFDTTLAENVALATQIGEIDLERLSHALRLAQLDGFVKTLPRGYLEIVGEHGVHLSGGQRQRVGIARALYRRASVLVLDEPTSALDGLTEREVIATLEELKGHCTILLIAHRPSTVRCCDLIFEIDCGTVVAAGTYRELVTRSQRFSMVLHGEDSPPESPSAARADAVAGAHTE